MIACPEVLKSSHSTKRPPCLNANTLREKICNQLCFSFNQQYLDLYISFPIYLQIIPKELSSSSLETSYQGQWGSSLFSRSIFKSTSYRSNSSNDSLVSYFTIFTFLFSYGMCWISKHTSKTSHTNITTKFTWLVVGTMLEVAIIVTETSYLLIVGMTWEFCPNKIRNLSKWGLIKLSKWGIDAT